MFKNNSGFGNSSEGEAVPQNSEGFLHPTFGVREPLGHVQGFCWTPGPGGAGLSSVAKQVGTGGVTGGGTITD